MSRQRFLAGLAATLLVVAAFYTWLLSRVFEMPGARVVRIMSAVALAEVVVGIQGYRRWRAQNRDGVETALPPNYDRILQIALYVVAVGIPTWAAIYLGAREFRWSTRLVALAALGTAVHGLSSVTDSQSRTSPHNEIGHSSGSAGLLGVVATAFNAALLVALAIAFLVQREYVLTLGLVIVAFIVVPSSVRRIGLRLRTPRSLGQMPDRRSRR